MGVRPSAFWVYTPLCTGGSPSSHSPPKLLILACGRIVADGSADQLARQVSGQAEVRWACDGQRFVHATDDATRFVRELFAQYGDKISDLEVRRASLEDTYMTLLREFEAGRGEVAVREFTEVAR